MPHIYLLIMQITSNFVCGGEKRRQKFVFVRRVVQTKLYELPAQIRSNIQAALPKLTAIIGKEVSKLIPLNDTPLSLM